MGPRWGFSSPQRGSALKDLNTRKLLKCSMPPFLLLQYPLHNNYKKKPSNSDNDSHAVMMLSMLAVVIDLAEVSGFR